MAEAFSREENDLKKHIEYIDQQAKMCEVNPSLVFIEQLRRRTYFLLYDDNSPITADRKRIEELEESNKAWHDSPHTFHRCCQDGKIRAHGTGLCSLCMARKCQGIKECFNPINRINELEAFLNSPADLDMQKTIADQTAEIERLRGALTKIAAYNDKTAEAHFWKEGNYAAFDEPSSVKIARQALDAGKKPSK